MNTKNALAATVFFFVFWFGLLSLSGSLFSGFHFTDDHQIIAYSETLKSAGAIETSVNWIGQDVKSIGRFLPVYYIHRLLQIKFFGTDFLIWAVYDGLLASLSSSFLAFFMLMASFTLFEAILFPLLLFLGFQTGIWWRFGTAETIGMLIMSIMLIVTAAGVRRKSRLLDVLFIALGILLMLTKETFILFIPALLFLKVWLGKKEKRNGWPGAIKREALPTAVLLVLMASELVFIKFFVGTTGIGYAGYEGFNTGPIISALINYLFASQAWLVAASLALAMSVTPRDKRRCVDIIAVFILLVLSLLPQAVLHAKSGVSERYILPGVFGAVFAIVYFLRLAREGLSQGRPPLRAGTVFAWAVALGFVVLGAFMIGHRKFGITFTVENLSLLSEVDPVPALTYASAWLHGFTQKAFLWIAGFVLIVCAIAERNSALSNFLNQKTFIGFVLVWAALFNLSIGFDNAFHSAFQGRKTNEWLRSIEENTGKDDAILIVADPAANNEWALSIKRYLSVQSGRRNLYAYPVYTKPAYTPFENTLISSFGTIYERNISGVPDASFKAIAVFPEAEQAFLAEARGWFNPSAYTKYVNEYGFVSYYRAW